MPSLTTYEKKLTRLRTVLKKHGRPMTARQLARALRCSKPTVYTRVESLIEAGVKVRLGAAPKGKKRGPRAVTFAI